MNMKKTVLFQQALEIAIQMTLSQGSALGDEVVLVRDLRGRIRPVLPSKPTGDDRIRLQQYQVELSHGLGAYGFDVDRAVLFADELAEPEAAFRERRLVGAENGVRVFLLDRQIIGQDWMRDTLQRKTRNPRITFYGVKGGVGRSTALVNWAWHLAKQGKRVLVFDLDLESPGLSSSLLPPDHLPDFGIVDWFVEDGVAQAPVVESEMPALSPLAQELAGEIRVIPAYGGKTGSYLPKLSRCYAEFNGDGPQSWAERVQRLVETFETSLAPDVVILDSRAGLHDIAAVLVTRMDADALLFAVDSPQTWAAYSLLFKHWRSHPQIRNFRTRLQIVASMVPETGRDAYLQGFRENAWDLFSQHLYEDAAPDDIDAFNFNRTDEEAPHSPLPILWHRALQEFNPAMGGIDSRTASESFGSFMEQADRLLETSGQEDLA